MKAAPRAAALLLLTFAGCRPAPAAPAEPSSAAPPSPPPPVVLTAEPVAIAAPAPSASAVPTAAAAAPAPPPPPAHPIVREEARVTLDGVEETWRIEWTEPPKDACFDETRFSCLCKGWTFGESGKFDIVRARPGLKEQRVHQEGILQRWPELPADRDDKALDVAKVKRRPVVPLMRFDDYNHDGKKAEFVLQTGAGNPCGRTPAVLVGVNSYTNTLQIFGTGKSPGTPLELEHRSDWEKLKANVPLTLLQLSCGDHGAPTQITLIVDAKMGVFSAREVRNECSEDFSKVGKVVGAEDR